MNQTHMKFNSQGVVSFRFLKEQWIETYTTTGMHKTTKPLHYAYHYRTLLKYTVVHLLHTTVCNLHQFPTHSLKLETVGIQCTSTFKHTTTSLHTMIT